MKTVRYRDFVLQPNSESGHWDVVDPFDQHLGAFASERDARKHVDSLLGSNALTKVLGPGLAAVLLFVGWKFLLKLGLISAIASTFSSTSP